MTRALAAASAVLGMLLALPGPVLAGGRVSRWTGDSWEQVGTFGSGHYLATFEGGADRGLWMTQSGEGEHDSAARLREVLKDRQGAVDRIRRALEELGGR